MNDKQLSISDVSYKNTSYPMKTILNSNQMKTLVDNFSLTPAQLKVLSFNLSKNCCKGSYLASQGVKPLDVAMIALEAAQYDINIDNVEAAIVPYNKKPTLQIMPLGILKLIGQNPNILKFEPFLVYGDEYFAYNPFSIEQPIEHEINFLDERNPQNITHAYVYYVINKGGHIVHGAYVMSKQEIEKHRNCSANYNKSDNSSSLWVTRREDMFKKTVLKKAAKFAPINLKSNILHQDFNEDNQNNEPTPTSSYTPSAPAPQTPPPAQKTQPVTPAASESVTINQEPSQQQDVEQTNVFDSFGDEV